MGTILQGFWTDPAQFRAGVRALVGLFGAALLAGIIPGIHSETAQKLGAFIIGGAGIIPAGQQNTTPAAASPSAGATTAAVPPIPPAG